MQLIPNRLSLRGSFHPTKIPQFDEVKEIKLYPIKDLKKKKDYRERGL